MSLRGAAQHIGIAPALRFERIGEIKLRGFSFSTELFAACLAHEEE